VNWRWLAVAVAALIAGCGGRSDDAAYDLWETDSCLLDKGYHPTLVETDDPAAYRGEPGANGVLEIKADGTAVDIRFEDDSTAATVRAGLLEKSAVAAGREDAADAIETKRNVMYWAKGDLKVGDRHAEAFDDVDSCLSD
jgi:hypothetical protein